MTSSKSLGQRSLKLKRPWGRRKNMKSLINIDLREVSEADAVRFKIAQIFYQDNPEFTPFLTDWQRRSFEFFVAPPIGTKLVVTDDIELISSLSGNLNDGSLFVLPCLPAGSKFVVGKIKFPDRQYCPWGINLIYLGGAKEINLEKGAGVTLQCGFQLATLDGYIKHVNWGGMKFLE